MLYDGLGRRVKEHTVVGATITDRNTVWDGLAMAQWQNPDGTVQRNLYASGEQTTAGAATTSLVYISDHLGSVRGWYNPADGTSGSADVTAYGHYQHEASSLILAHARVYDSETGRWLSRDPIGEQAGLNVYSYVRNDPVRHLDPFGLCLCEEVCAFIFTMQDGADFRVRQIAALKAGNLVQWQILQDASIPPTTSGQGPEKGVDKCSVSGIQIQAENSPALLKNTDDNIRNGNAVGWLWNWNTILGKMGWTQNELTRQNLAVAFGDMLRAQIPGCVCDGAGGAFSD